MTQSQNQANGAAIFSRSQKESRHIQMLHERAQYFDFKVKMVVK